MRFGHSAQRVYPGDTVDPTEIHIMPEVSGSQTKRGSRTFDVEG